MKIMPFRLQKIKICHDSRIQILKLNIFNKDLHKCLTYIVSQMSEHKKFKAKLRSMPVKWQISTI